MSWLTLKSLYILVATVLPINSQIVDISLKGQYVCSLHPNNQLWVELLAYDENGVAIRMNAIDVNKTDIITCSVSGTGNMISPFFVSTKVSLTDSSQVENICGVRPSTVSGRTVYDWQFKAYAYASGGAIIRKGFILNVRCDTADLKDGKVETLVDINVPNLQVTAANPVDVTGINSVATGASVVYTASLYPNGRNIPAVLDDAVEIYMYNCFTATSSDMTEDRQLFIDANGCPVSGATFAPSGNFQSVSTTGDYFSAEARFGTARVVNGMKTIYMTCQVGKCTQTNDPFCTNRCAAHNNGQASPSGVDTGYTYTTSFNIQDQQAQQLAPTRTSDQTVLTTANVGTTIRLISYNFPSGLGGTSDLLDAKGFYVYNCRYADNEAMNNPTQFVDNGGCLIPNTKLSPGSNFVYDSTLSAPSVNKYVLRSGAISLQNTGNLRLWVRCDTGKCTASNHNYCQNRCGATNNIVGGAENLGYRGQMFSLSLLDTVNVPAVNIMVKSSSGTEVTSTVPVNVGDSMSLGLQVTPGGTGVGSGAFANAQGIYLYSCTVTSTTRPAPEMFIDQNGCPVEGSPYRTSETCKDVTAVSGVPPYSVDCGTFTVSETGNITQECRVGICTTTNNPFCQDRCAAGAITPESNVVEPGITSAKTFMAEEVDLRRTATRSDELRNIIIGISVTGAVLLFAGVIIGTCIIVSKQRSRAKRELDERSYRY